MNDETPKPLEGIVIGKDGVPLEGQAKRPQMIKFQVNGVKAFLLISLGLFVFLFFVIPLFVLGLLVSKFRR